MQMQGVSTAAELAISAGESRTPTDGSPTNASDGTGCYGAEWLFQRALLSCSARVARPVHAASRSAGCWFDCASELRLQEPEEQLPGLRAFRITNARNEALSRRKGLWRLETQLIAAVPNLASFSQAMPRTPLRRDRWRPMLLPDCK